MVPVEAKQIKLFVFYNKNPKSRRSRIEFELGNVLATGNPIEAATKFMRERYPRLFFSTMIGIGRLGKASEEVELFGMLFGMRNRKTRKMTARTEEVIFCLSRTSGLATREEVVNSISVLQNSRPFVREKFMTFSHTSIEETVKRLEKSIPVLGNA